MALAASDRLALGVALRRSGFNGVIDGIGDKIDSQAALTNLQKRYLRTNLFPRQHAELLIGYITVGSGLQTDTVATRMVKRAIRTALGGRAAADAIITELSS